jgi:hypothetical protein
MPATFRLVCLGVRASIGAVIRPTSDSCKLGEPRGRAFLLRAGGRAALVGSLRPEANHGVAQDRSFSPSRGNPCHDMRCVRARHWLRGWPTSARTLPSKSPPQPGRHRRSGASGHNLFARMSALIRGKHPRARPRSLSRRSAPAARQTEEVVAAFARSGRQARASSGAPSPRENRRRLVAVCDAPARIIFGGGAVRSKCPRGAAARL